MTTNSRPHTIDHLDSSRSIAARYRLPGPHATVVMRVPTPGTAGDDLDLRWSAVRRELLHLGAHATTIGHLDEAIDTVRPRGSHALFTADETGAAVGWLTAPSVDAMASVSDLPDLVPALDEVALRYPVVAVAIDRIGADIHIVHRTDIASVETVDGEDEDIHKAGGGGWSQANHQRHSEVLWQRNAQSVADAISAQCDHHGAQTAVLSGDQRAVALVAERLGSRPQLFTTVVQAGGRHEPGTRDRLHTAAVDVLVSDRDATKRRLAERLEEELGQNDRAVAGRDATREALDRRVVGTLFVDETRLPELTGVGAAVRDALEGGAEVVGVNDVRLEDGLAALLRTSNQAASPLA